MEKEKAITKLKELGIDTRNFFDKRTFRYRDDVYVGIFPVEAKREETFYFSVNGEDLLYMMKQEDILKCELDEHLGQKKYQVLLSDCTLLWKDEGVYEEKTDEPFNKMTIRDFFSIYHKKPVSNKEWLNALIKGL